MIRHIWTILAKDILTDSETKLVSYINCIEELVPSRLPAPLPPIGIGTVWEKDSDVEEELRVRVSLVTPSNNSKLILESQAIKVTTKRQRLNIIAGNLLIDEEGIYKIRLERLNGENWDFIVDVPFMINLETNSRHK